MIQYHRIFFLQSACGANSKAQIKQMCHVKNAESSMNNNKYKLNNNTV